MVDTVIEKKGFLGLNDSQRRGLDYLGLLVCVISWGSAFVVVRSAAANMTPMTMTMFRLVFAALFFLPLAIKNRHTCTLKEIWSCKKYLFFMSLFGSALFMFNMCVGLEYTTATNAALINGLNPIVIVFAAAVFTKVKVKKIAYLPLIFAVCGAIILIWFKPANMGSGFSMNIGDLFFVGNVIAWAAFSVILIPFNNRLHWSVWGFIINAFAAIMLLVLTPWFPISFADVPMADFVKVAYAGLVCGGLSTALWNNAISRLGIATTALFNNLNPLSSVIFSMIFLHETMVGNQIIGAVMILGSLITYSLADFMSFRQSQKKKTELEQGKNSGGIMVNLKMEKIGVIFDMDNTILDTHIDFGKMKRVTVEAVEGFMAEIVAKEKPDFEPMVTGQVIKWAEEHGLEKEKVLLIWEKIADVEAEGMEEIQIEEDADLALKKLAESGANSFILTNNSLRAAKIAMAKSGLADYFKEIHARDEYGEVKPSPKGILAIIKDHPNIEKWVMIGDSWLDGGAANNAEIAFIAYGPNDSAYWNKYDIEPKAVIKKWSADSAVVIAEVLK